jgi:hypothetical protein
MLTQLDPARMLWEVPLMLCAPRIFWDATLGMAERPPRTHWRAAVPEAAFGLMQQKPAPTTLIQKWIPGPQLCGRTYLRIRLRIQAEEMKLKAVTCETA